MTLRWIEEWPTEPGWYWFYGWMSSFGVRNRHPDTYLVVVRQDSTGHPILISGSRFIYREEGATGKWAQMKLPTPPKLEGEQDEQKTRHSNRNEERG